MISLSGVINKCFIRSSNTNTIVLGHQKSGTTVIGNLLSIYSDYSYTNDPLYQIDMGKGEAAYKLLSGEISLDMMVKRYRRLFGLQIIKEPDFIFITDQVLEVFPDAKYVYIVRDPRDNIRSIFNRLGFVPGELADYKHINRHWEMILKGNLPVLKDGASEDFILNLSRRWVLAANIYVKHIDKLQLLRYEDFLKDKKREIYSIAKKLGMSQVNAIDQYVDRQYQPKGDSTVDLMEFYGERYLDMINNECGQAMDYFGYVV